MPVAADYNNKVQTYFIAFLGRPASASELSTWTTALNNNSGSVWNSGLNAYLANVAGFGTAVPTAADAGNMVQDMFARITGDASMDMTLYNYYVGQLLTGGIKAKGLANAMLNDLGMMPRVDGTWSRPDGWVTQGLSASAADLTAIQSKVGVANAFTAALDTAEEDSAFTSSPAGAVSLLAGVTNAATATTATANVPATVTSTVNAANASAGQTFTLTTGVNTIPGLVGSAGNTSTAGNDIINGVVGNIVSGAALISAETLSVLDALDGGAGSNTLNIQDQLGGTTITGMNTTNIQTVNVKSVAALDVNTTSGFTGVTSLGVLQGTDVTAKAADTTDIAVSGVTGTIAVNGGKNITVSDATLDKNIDIGATLVNKGTVTVTDTKQGTGTIKVDGGTDVTITATSAKASGVITVGQGGAATDLPSGKIVIVDNLNSDGAAAFTGGNITTSGGTTVDVTINANKTATVDTTTNGITAGNVRVNSGAATTAVTVTQTSVDTEFTKVGTAVVKETSVVTFGAMKSGEALTFNGLTFTAAADLTAEQVAAAFANLTASDTQSATGPVKNGIFTGTFNTAVWTSGAVSGKTVTFTAKDDNQTDLSFTGTAATNDAGARAPTQVKTAGTAAATDSVSSGSNAYGSVRVDGNGGTETVTDVTLSGYASADLGQTGSALNALKNLSLANSAGTATVDATVTSLNLAVNNVKHAVDLDSGTASVATLSVSTAGKDSAFALTAAAAKDLTVSGTQALDLTGSTLTVLENVTVKDSAGLNLGAAVAAKSINTAATTGTVTATIDGSAATYTGGAGVDKVTLNSATVSKAIDLGDGNDTLTLASGTTSLGIEVKGGNGTDTLTMAAANAATATVTSDFATKVTSFETLSLQQVQAGDGSLSVNLANLDNVNYVISAGAATAALGSTETAVVTFQPLKSGQSVTVAGRTVTATADVTAAQIEAAFLAGATIGNAAVSGALAGWTVAESGANNNGALLFTATTAGNVVNIATSDADATAPTSPVVTNTNGVTPVTESSVVSFQGLIAGETVTVAGRTINAGTFETAVFTAATIANAETVTIGGYTVTCSNGGGNTAAEVITVLTGGVVAGLVRTGTLDAEYTLAGTTATTATFTRTTLGNDASDIAVGGTDANPGSVAVDNGELSNLTAASVAALASSGSSIADVATVTGTLTGFTAGGLSGNSVTFTSTGAGNVSNIVVSTTAGTAPTVTTTQGVVAVTESNSVVFQALKSGQTVTVAGLTLTAAADMADTAVASAFASLLNNATGMANTTGALTGWSTGVAAGAAVTFTSSTASTDVAAIVVSTAGAGNPTDVGVVTTAGGVGAAAAGTVTLTKMANDGTLELTGTAVTTTVTMADATGSSDSLNIVSKVGTADINFGTVDVAGVETLKLTSTDTNVDEDSDKIEYETGERDTSTLTIKANEAKTINVAGNANTTLNWDAATTKVTLVDATNATGNLIAGTLTGSAMTIKGGSGSDQLTANGQSDVLLGGAGSDVLNVSAGANLATLTGGTGADVFAINGASTNVNNAATITDLSSGDVIKFSGANTFTSTAITLDNTAVFQDFANTAIKNLSANQMAWFQYGGNTYIVEDLAGSNTAFQNGTDLIVKITGLVDLSTASYNATGNTLEIA